MRCSYVLVWVFVGVCVVGSFADNERMFTWEEGGRGREGEREREREEREREEIEKGRTRERVREREEE